MTPTDRNGIVFSQDDLLIQNAAAKYGCTAVLIDEHNTYELKGNDMNEPTPTPAPEPNPEWTLEQILEREG